MDALPEKLDQKLLSWPADTSDAVREQLAELVEMADVDRLDLAQSWAVEQEVLDLIDERTAG